MSSNRSAVYETSLGASLGLAAQILQPGMAHRGACQKEVLGPMILAAHRFGQQHFKQITSIGDAQNPRNVLLDLQRDTLQSSNQVALGSAVNLALITFGDISWDFQGDVAQTLEMELLDIADRVEEAEKNACVLLSVSSQETSGRDVETAVIWIPRASNVHSKVAGRFLLYVYPGRAKVVKSVTELVKKLHEELSVINECDATYHVWTLMMKDSQSQTPNADKLQSPNSPLQNGGRASKTSAKGGKISVFSMEPEIGKSMFTFQRENVDLRQKNSSFDTFHSVLDQSIQSQSSLSIKKEVPDATICTQFPDSSKESPVNPQQYTVKDQASKPKRQPSKHSGVVSLSYADPRILKANERLEGAGSDSSGICKSADRAFEVRYPLPKRAPEPLELEQNEDMYDGGHDKIPGVNASATRLQWQNEEHHERAKATSIREVSPRPETESSIFKFSARVSIQELDIAVQKDSVSQTGIAKSFDKDVVFSVASNDHQPASSDDSHRSDYSEEEKSHPQTEMSHGSCPIQEPKPLRSACANYKAKLGARVWWELEYQAQKLLSQSSKKQNGSRSGRFAHEKPPPVTSSPFMKVKRETVPFHEQNRRQSTIQLSSAALITVDETENCCDQVLDDSNQDSVLITQTCEPPPTSLIGTSYHSLGSSIKTAPVRKSISNISDNDNHKASPSATRVSFQSLPIQAENSVSHSSTDFPWAQSSSITAALVSTQSSSQSVRDVNGSRSSRSSFKRSPLKWYETHEDEEEDDEEEQVAYSSNNAENVVDQGTTARRTTLSTTQERNETHDTSRRSSTADSEDIMMCASLIKAEPRINEVWNDYYEPEALTVSTNTHENAYSQFASPNNQMALAEAFEEDDISRWQMTSSNASYMTKREPEPTRSKTSLIHQGSVPIRRQPLRQDTTQTRYRERSTFACDDEPSVTYSAASDHDCSPVKPTKEPTPDPIVLTVEMDDVGSTVDTRQARQKRLAELRQKKLQQLQKAREEAISSRQKQRMGPTSALSTNDSDRGSMALFSNSNKNHHPTQAKRPSNRQLIQNALEFTLLAGGSMEKERTAALSALARSPCDNFVVLLKSAKDMKFRALYQVDRQQHDEVQRIFSVSTGAPQTLTSEAIGQFFKYNSGKKTFLPVETRSFTVKTDACALQERLVLKRQQQLARLL